MRVLGVIRLSRETDETTSPERQKAGLEAWALALGHEIVGWASDIDVSGKVSPWEREKLGAWLTDDPPLEYEVIAATKIDRLSRDLGDFVDLIEWTSKRGKYLVAYMDSVDTSTPTGELVAKVLAIFAEFERKTIAGRNRDSQAHAAQEGRWHGGIPPYGYKPEKSSDGWRLVIDEPAAEKIREIVKLVLEGKSLNHVAMKYNEQGVLCPGDHLRALLGKPPKGGMWTSSALSLLLSSKNLLGIAELAGKVVRGPDGLPIYRAEPILNRLEWENLQLRLSANSIQRPRTITRSPLLGVAFCIQCGHPIYRCAPKANRREYYRCRGRTFKNSGCTAQVTPGEPLMHIVENSLLAAVGDEEMFEEVAIPAESHQEELQEAEESYAYLQGEASKKPANLARLLKPQIEALEATIERLSALPESQARKEYRPTGKTYRSLWQATEPANRRDLLLKAGVRIEAGRQDSSWVSVGRFERPERYDQAVELGVFEGVQYAFYLPKDLVARTTGAKHQIPVS